MFTDAHIHILDYLEEQHQKNEFNNFEINSIYPDGFEVCICVSSNEKARYIKQKSICAKLPSNIKIHHSFGIHPQMPICDELYYLEELLNSREIIAIGECGFDLFNNEYTAKIEEQKEVWNIQLKLAIKYNVPLIIHCRRGLHLIFGKSKELKKVKAVVFHGWAGSMQEASSLLKRGINAYFCIGKALLRGQKSQIEMAESFALDRLLSETDAPYMKLKGEDCTVPKDIENVIEATAFHRKINKEELKKRIAENFRNALL